MSGFRHGRVQRVPQLKAGRFLMLCCSETRGKEEGIGTFWEGGMTFNNRPGCAQSQQSICCCCL